jgi:uncharacterized protein with HEPN domain
MSNKNNTVIKKFQPFTHENLEIKNELLNMARQARVNVPEKKIENDLASVLIYSSIAEYLAENLIDNLTHFVKTSTYNDFAGILFIKKINTREKMPLGIIIQELDKFEFPDKTEIINCFRNISSSRNRIFHNLAKSDLDETVELLSKDLPIIQERCEDLITRINTIYAGLSKILVQTQQEK